MSKHEVWGFTIERSPSGKKIWPNKLKREAARKIREDEASPGDIAAEIGAHECLVRKWSVADRRSRGELVIKEKPAFAQVNVTPEDTNHLVAMPSSLNTEVAKLEYGEVRLEFPVNIPEATLIAIIRAIGQAT